MGGFTRDAVEAVDDDWTDINRSNEALERLRLRKRATVKPEGLAAMSKVVWKISSFSQAVLYRIVALADGCADGWTHGNFLSSILCARSLVESVALWRDFQKQLTRLCDERDLAAIDTLVSNRLMGTKMSDWHNERPWSEAVNVLTMIGKLEAEIPNVKSAYATISDMCHPNVLGHLMLFGSLDRHTATYAFSDRTMLDRGHFDHAFACFMLVQLVEITLDHVEELLPTVAALGQSP